MLENSWSYWAAPISDRLWYSGIIIDIHANIAGYKSLVLEHQKEDDKVLAQKMFISRLSLVKLVADFIFCSIDVFHIRVSDGVQAISGLIAALLGTQKLYIKSSSNQ